MELASTEAAAWVQAVGTIVALIVAILIPYIGSRIEQKRSLVAARELGSQLISRLRFLAALAAQSELNATDSNETDLDLTGLSAMFKQFPVDRLGAPSIVSFLRLAGICSHARRVWVGDDTVLLGRTNAQAAKPKKSSNQIRKLNDALAEAEAAQLALSSRAFRFLKS